MYIFHNYMYISHNYVYISRLPLLPQLCGQQEAEHPGGDRVQEGQEGEAGEESKGAPGRADQVISSNLVFSL